MGKNYDNDEMEIDLLELFYVLKSKILAILGVGLLFITNPVMILWFMKYYEEGLLLFVR